MKRTVTRLFDSRFEAEAAVRDLEDMGVPADDISIIARDKAAGEDRSFLSRDSDHDGENDTAEGAGKGAAAGGAIGAGAGLLAGLGLVAVPGLGPVVAAGWLAATLAGALGGAVVGGATGGVLGALTDAGVSEEDAHVYAEGVRRGGSLVSVRVDEADVIRIETALNGLRGTDAATRGAAYRQEGWTHFDPATPGYEGDRGATTDRFPTN